MSFRSLRHSSAFPTRVIHTIPRILIPLALILSTYLYLYPVFLGCVFTSIDGSFETAFRDTLAQHINYNHINPIDTHEHLAPFRLLVLADPQLEGDSSLPDPEDALSNKLFKHWARIRELEYEDLTIYPHTIKDIVQEVIRNDIPIALQAARKRLDLFGNDYYLAHIYRTLHWWTKPTHVTVLGDLIGSQWVDDEEFEWRGWRYWNRVFAGSEKISDELLDASTQDSGIMIPMDDPTWRTKIINIAGNHDIGYAGDITRERMQRFEKKYGRANWDVKFEYPASRTPTSNNTDIDPQQPTLHLVVFNSMLLDTPPMDTELQTETYAYLNSLITNRVHPVTDTQHFTLLLTHVPLHKEAGICPDSPMFSFWDESDCTAGDCLPGALKEQNHLSKFASRNGMLASIFGMSGNLESPADGRGRRGLVLTGHDHEGCDTWHYIPANTTFRKSEVGEGEEVETVWEAERWGGRDGKEVSAHTGVREVTLRSMMGEFGGNAGLLSAWYDFERSEWKYDIQMCRLGVQHYWWAVHVIDLVAIASLLLSWLIRLWPRSNDSIVTKRDETKSLKLE